MTPLIRGLILIILLLAFLIVLIGFLYIVAVEIDYILEVDILWKVKQKARRLIYGQSEEERKTVKRISNRRKVRSKPNAERIKNAKKHKLKEYEIERIEH